jgi:hypothetical protein
VIQDDHNHVIDNKVLNPKDGHGIFIMAGDMAYTSNTPGGHAQAAFTEVRGNTGPLYLGHQFGSSYTFPALNTAVSNHTGPIIHQNDKGTTIS